MSTEKNCEACTMLNSVDADKCTCCETAFPANTIRPVPIPKEEVEEKSEEETDYTEHQKLCKVIG
jgi:hypothetical protein